jgi:hypothetical protein
MAANLPIDFHLDESLIINCELTGADGEVASLSGLSSGSIRWGISAERGSTYIASAIIGDGITVTGSTSGECRVSFGSTLQADLYPGRFWHELRLAHSDGVSIQFEGPARIRDSMYASTAS